MIIAYPLQDITSSAKGRPIYQKMGFPAIVIEFMGDMAILQNSRGNCFPARKENLIWAHTGP